MNPLRISSHLPRLSFKAVSSTQSNRNVWSPSSRKSSLQFLTHVHPVIISLQQTRGYKYKRSFLSDEEGVNDFIDLLAPQERQVLLDVLNQRIQQQSSVKDPHEECPPSIGQLRLVFLHQLLPFVGFGFLDNLIMILAGEYIDTTIGVTLGISTMAAAALGNALSDVAGIGSAWYVEKWANHFGVKYPNLTRTQVDMTSTKFATTSGRAFGVFLGCILGMIPLLFMNTKKCQDEDTSHVKTVSKKD